MWNWYLESPFVISSLHRLTAQCLLRLAPLLGQGDTRRSTFGSFRRRLRRLFLLDLSTALAPRAHLCPGFLELFGRHIEVPLLLMANGGFRTLRGLGLPLTRLHALGLHFSDFTVAKGAPPIERRFLARFDRRRVLFVMSRSHPFRLPPRFATGGPYLHPAGDCRIGHLFSA